MTAPLPIRSLCRQAMGIAAFWCFGAAPGVSAAFDAKRHLFLDPAILATTEGAVLKANPAQRRETVISPDRPWERHMISFFLTVRDEGGKLRMWYVCRDDWGAGGQANLAYAESTDGITWSKPDLGVYEYKGSRANNLVGVHSLEGVVFRDPNMPPEQRYIYVSTGKAKTADKAVPVPTSIFRHHSPDGLHWQRDPQPLIEAGSDTQNVVWWDELRKEYVVIVRGWTTDGYRKVNRLALPSLTVPTSVRPDRSNRRQYFNQEIPTILICDGEDPVRTDIYNLSAQPYVLDPHWYVAFPTFLRRWAANDERRQPGMKSSVGPTEVQFAGSRDSLKWHRYDRPAYAPPGIAAPEKKNMVFMGTGLVVRRDEIWQYGTEFESAHGDIEARKRKTDGFIVRWVQRVDGFVSLDTGTTAGSARTVPVKVAGRQLLLNLDTGALGELRVGLVGADGRPVPGFAVEDCAPIEYTNRTKLYSFRFE
ncbi:MAG: hypothetical protein HZC55_27420 [Verrucomicrobia bacterium]|nr:hypothetical protein [Verrucomicrobiota bacterium]